MLKQTVISESAFNDAFGSILFTSILKSITLSQKLSLLETTLQLSFMIFIGLSVGATVVLIGTALSSNKRFGILLNMNLSYLW